MQSLGVTGEINPSKQYEWKIANFFSLSARNYVFYDSPSFTYENSSWHLRIYPGGCIATPGMVSVLLATETSCMRLVTLAYYIKKNDGTLIEMRSTDDHTNIYTRYRDICERSLLQEKKSELVPSGTLTIIFILKLHDEEKAFEKAKDEKLPDKKAHRTAENKTFTEMDLLSKNFKDLYANEDCSDTVLLVQGREFKVHQSILIARSPVFAAMFRHDTTEKQTGKVTIEDCDPDSFEQFLEYLYCGRLENMSSDSALSLYSTSDKYNMQELKTFCTTFLMQNLSVQNVCDVVTLADQYNETNLLAQVQNFFNENLKEILVTSEWEDLFKRNFRLANKMLVEMSKAK